MELPVRILFITPYPELKQQLASIIPHYPAAKITIAEGDLGQGLIQAQRHLRPEYDAVISRGGTAELLRAAISIPVTEVEVSPYDILRALNPVGGGRALLVAHENITRSAQKLRELIDCHLEVVPLSPCSSVRDILRGLHPEGRALLCDTVAYTTALELGYHPHLVLSGDDSIRQAIDQTLLLCQARRTLSAENHFFRQLLLGQIANTVVLDDNGGLVLSSCDDLPRPLLELLRTMPLEKHALRAYLPREKRERMDLVRAALEQDREGRLTLPQLARAHGMGVSALKEQFLAVYGLPPMTFRSQCRMRRAACLLTHTELSVAEIAGRLGYENASKFSAAFRRTMGEAPALYRKNHAAERSAHGPAE